MSIQQLAQQYEEILQREREVERAQLEQYRRKLTELGAAYARVKPSPPKPLTVPAIFNRSFDENFISDYLAYVLNPAKNGIGEAPLAQLLELCAIDPTDLPLAEVTIYREYFLEGKRIDLLLEWDDRQVIGIENKIHSPEGEGQTPHYGRVISELFEGRPVHLVYLTRGGKKPRSKKFQPISYEQLWTALRNVAVPTTVSTRQRVLWEDFLEHLEVYVIMSDPDQFEFSDKAKLYLEHIDMLQDLEDAILNEWGDAIVFLEQQVQAQLEGGPWITQFNGPKHIWHKVNKEAWESSELRVHYEYWFSPKSLNEGKIYFMIDVEGKRAGDFLTRFGQRYRTLEEEYRRRDLQYRPSHRKFAIVWKDYPIAREFNEVAQTFIEAFNEARFLEPEIDAVLVEM